MCCRALSRRRGSLIATLASCWWSRNCRSERGWPCKGTAAAFLSECFHPLEGAQTWCCLTAECLLLRTFKKQAEGLHTEHSCVQSKLGSWRELVLQFPQTLDLLHKVVIPSSLSSAECGMALDEWISQQDPHSCLRDLAEDCRQALNNVSVLVLCWAWRAYLASVCGLRCLTTAGQRSCCEQRSRLLVSGGMPNVRVCWYCRPHCVV